MTITGFAIVCFRQLFAVVMLSGIFSLLAASLYVLLSAVDVAFTEASVGAGISTLLLLATLALTSDYDTGSGRNKLWPKILVTITGLHYFTARWICLFMVLQTHQQIFI